jgi:hypothetical protein
VVSDMVKELIFENAFKQVCADVVEETKGNISIREFITYKRFLLSELELNAR